MAYGVAAILISALIAASISFAYAQAACPAYSGFLGGCGACGSPKLCGYGPALGGPGLGSWGLGGIGPGIGITGFDSWGWGGIGPKGIVGPGECGYNRHARGFVWSPWNPASFW
jgi:hypothetical protein